MDDHTAFITTARQGYRAANTTSEKMVQTDLGPQLMHFDNWRSGSWDVFTHGGFMTYPHNDAAGMMTFSYVRTGAKLWGYLDIDGTDHGNQAAVLKGWNDYYSEPLAYATYDKGVKVGTVLLEVGGVL